jgi:hypothetical protein
MVVEHEELKRLDALRESWLLRALYRRDLINQYRVAGQYPGRGSIPRPPTREERERITLAERAAWSAWQAYVEALEEAERTEPIG